MYARDMTLITNKVDCAHLTRIIGDSIFPDRFLKFVLMILEKPTVAMETIAGMMRIINSIDYAHYECNRLPLTLAYITVCNS